MVRCVDVVSKIVSRFRIAGQSNLVKQALPLLATSTYYGKGKAVLAMSNGAEWRNGLARNLVCLASTFLSGALSS